MDDFKKYFSASETENPLDTLVSDGGYCGVLRTIACVGDSLSSGEFESKDAEGKTGYHDYFDYSWGQYLARMAGCTVYNFSRGGMTAHQYTDSFAEQKGFWSTEKAAQGYIIALGVNDIYYSDIEFGDISDICLDNYNNNRKTFVGCYAKIIQRYKEIQPKAKFFLVTLPRANDTPERNEKADKHAKLLYQLAKMFDNTYVLDLRKYGPIYDEEFSSLFYLGGHMNAMGYVFTAKLVASYIDYIIRHNMDDFRQIGFVGTPYHNPNYKW